MSEQIKVNFVITVDPDIQARIDEVLEADDTTAHGLIFLWDDEYQRWLGSFADRVRGDGMTFTLGASAERVITAISDAMLASLEEDDE